MAKYRYYITDMFQGAIVGTDNEQAAHDHSLTEESFVLDTQEGKWLINGALHDIVELKVSDG